MNIGKLVRACIPIIKYNMPFIWIINGLHVNDKKVPLNDERIFHAGKWFQIKRKKPWCVLQTWTGLTLHGPYKKQYTSQEWTR
jgi:hypothetical protein